MEKYDPPPPYPETEDSPPAPEDSSLPPWLSQKRIKIASICIYCLLSFMCFCIFVPISMTLSNSNDECILYGDTIGFGQISVCNFCIAITVILLIICALRAVFIAIELTKYGSKLPVGFFNRLIVKVIILIAEMVMSLLLLVVASIISAGFSHLCGSLFGGRSECDSEHGIGLFPSGDVNDTYYNQLVVAEGSAWFTFCLWLLFWCVKLLIFYKEGLLAKSTTKAKSLFGGKNASTSNAWTTHSASQSS